jgi:tRNA pseudouridine55 synthase
MDGIILINKEKGYTSRDVVNKVSNSIGIKKVGHSGTLDPLATGLLVILVGKATKVSDLITNTHKEYICEVKMGIQTDTLDVTGEILEEQEYSIEEKDLKMVINNFHGKYIQEVPKYSAVRVNGKRLYEYAREGKEVELPKREVQIKEIELLEFNNETFKFRCLVSKGTYIRSLVRDIGLRMNTPMTMNNLHRTKQDIFDVKDSFTVEEVEKDNYEVLNLKEVLSNYTQVVVDDFLMRSVINGKVITNDYKSDIVIFIDKSDKVLAIYETYKKDETKIKPRCVLG